MKARNLYEHLDPKRHRAASDHTCPCRFGSRCSYRFLAFIFLFFLSDNLPSSLALPLTWAPRLIVAKVSELISSSLVFLICWSRLASSSFDFSSLNTRFTSKG